MLALCAAHTNLCLQEENCRLESRALAVAAAVSAETCRTYVFSTFAHILFPSQLISLLKDILFLFFFIFFFQMSNSFLCAILLSSPGRSKELPRVEGICLCISSAKGKTVTVHRQAAVSISLCMTLFWKLLTEEKKICKRLGFLYTYRAFHPPMTEFISSIKQESQRIPLVCTWDGLICILLLFSVR